MTQLMSTLLLVAYVTAGVVGMQMMAGSLARLTGFERLPGQRGLVRQSLTTAGSVILLLAGLFLAIQAAVVIVWTFS